MYPEPTELLLIGCLTESTWFPRSKSNTSTPKTNSLTFWPKEVAHVMNGIILCVYLTLVISVPPIVLKWCGKEHKKIQMKNGSQQNQSRWRSWSRDAAKGLLTCWYPLHQKVRWNQMRKSITSELVHWAASKNGETNKDAYSSDYSEWNIDEKWSSQVWKPGEMLETSTGRPVDDKFVIDNDMDSDTVTESKLVRAVTKWTRACDKRMARLISYIHHASDYWQYCHVGNTAQQCGFGLFHDSVFVGDLEDSKTTSWWILCIIGSLMFVPISWM